jgi:hypothetical protein
MKLRSVQQDRTALTIRFHAYPGDDREYGARFDVPARIGDEQWSSFVEPESSVDDWAIWGIVCRLVEEYDTTDHDNLPVESGVHWFNFQ